MLRHLSLQSRKSPRNASRYAARGKRDLSLEPLEQRAMLSAVPFDPGFDPGACNADELMTAAGQYAQDFSQFSSAAGDYFQAFSDSGDGSFLSVQYFSESQISGDNHFAMTQYDFTLIAYTACNNGPSADAGGPYAVIEGDPLTLDASASSDADGDPLEYSWDLNADGAFDDASGVDPTLQWSQLESLGINDDGVYTVAVQVDDGFGGIEQAETTITVDNAPPEVAVNASSSDGTEGFVEGTPIDLESVVADPSSADTHSLLWNVTRDGEAYAEGQAEDLQFTPDDNGAYEVTLTVTDDDGGEAVASSTIEVTNAAPKADILGAPETSPEGTPIELAGAVADPGSADTHSLLWNVTKDGEAYAEGQAEDLQFTPDDNGTYEVTLTVTDDDGGEAVASSTIEVTNAAPKADILGAPETSPEGTPIDLASAVADPGTADTHSLLWNVTKDGEAYAEGQAEDLQFTPDDNGTYEVTLSVTDDDGGEAVASSTIDVTNVAPQLENTSVPELIDEGGTFTLAADIVDPGTADDFKLQVEWGDGNTDTVAYAAGATSLSESHVYEFGGVYTVDLTLVDDDQGAASAAETAVVSGVGVNDGVLQVIGSAGNDHAIVGELPDGRLVVSADFVKDPWQPRFVDAAGIERVDMLLGDGNDLGVIAGNVDTPALIDGGTGNDHLAGGAGDDVVLGGDGRDLLLGARGSDLLVGGAESDMIVGSGDDVLVGGSTAYDAHTEALLSLMAEWTSGRSMGARADNLSGSGDGDRLNGEFFLTSGTSADDPSATVFDDQAPDLLIGGLAHDLFFASSGDDDGSFQDLLLGFGPIGGGAIG